MIIGGTNLGPFKTHSDVLVFGNYIYFRGTDNKVWRVKTDGIDSYDPRATRRNSMYLLPAARCTSGRPTIWCGDSTSDTDL
ncbi:hypothetical protein ABH944_000566 [Caballeronia udeis]|uniref:Uncharacterized protein n=1 Tax=Caballeronia udeis TaxID=1232866 RepID=A0ABW8MCR6_9BURK